MLPAVNLLEVPYLTPIKDEVLDTVRGIYQAGQVLPSPVNPGVFSVVGNVPPSTALLADLGDGSADFGTLADAVELSDLVFYYVSTPLPGGGNSFTGGGALASDTAWRIADLMESLPADAGPCLAGESPLVCELRVNRPAVVIVIVGHNDLSANTPLEEFQTSYEALIQTSIDMGVIPVLTTIPGDPASLPLLQDYNAAIVTLAEDYQVPVVNMWRSINDIAPLGLNLDLTLTTAGTGDVFGDAELNGFGAPRRAVLLLRALQALRAEVPIP